MSSKKNSSGFLYLIEKKRWRAVRKQLLARNKNNVHELIRNQGFQGLSTLSLALGHNAPIDIIELILDIDPSLALKRDFLGATPLHIACLNGADVAAIQLLIEQYPNLVNQCDNDNRTPLHHAVEYVCQLEGAGDSVITNVVDVIKTLLELCPEIVHSMDKHGDSPMDLAHVIMMETDTSFEDDASTFSRVEFVYKLLKKVSVDVYINKKKQWEEMGYDTSKKDMTELVGSLADTSTDDTQPSSKQDTHIESCESAPGTTTRMTEDGSRVGRTKSTSV